MKNIVTGFALLFSVSLFANDIILVKVEEGDDLGEVRMALNEAYGNRLIGFVHSTNEFVLRCETNCEELLEKSSVMQKFETRIVTEEAYKEISSQK